MRLALFIVFSLWTSLGFSQVQLRGKVVHDSTGLPLESAQISAVGTKFGTTTGSDGSFVLTFIVQFCQLSVHLGSTMSTSSKAI